MLGGVAAVGRAQADRAGVVAEQTGHGGDAVHRVVVPRPAGEAHAAGDGQLAVEAEAQLVGRDLHRRREARVEVDVGQVVDADAGELEGAAARPGGWRARSTGRPGWTRTSGRGRRRRLGEHPPILGDAERLGAGSTEHRMRPAPCSTMLLEFIRFVYGIADHAVVRRGGGDLLGGVGLLDPGVGVAWPPPR